MAGAQGADVRGGRGAHVRPGGARQICASCGIERDFRREGGPVCRLGLCNGKAVYGYFGAAEVALEPVALAVGGRDDVACVLVPRVTRGWRTTRSARRFGIKRDFRNID